MSVTAKVENASWEKKGAEAAVLTVFVDGKYNQDLILYGGEREFEYRALLGRLETGKHRIALVLNEARSAPNARGVKIRSAKVGGDMTNFGSIFETIALENAPVIYLRPETIDKFSDIPLVTYYEIFDEPGGAKRLRYTTVFSNEDGGTLSQALLARWGRLTDIEWTYELRVGADGVITGEIFQGANHETKNYRGARRLGNHPALFDATVNNNFADQGCSPVSLLLPPLKADLRAASRETVMDRHAWTYRVMSGEAIREGRVNPARLGVNAVADPRDYFYVEIETELENASVALEVVGDDGETIVSDEGEPRQRLSRDGFNRIAVRRPGSLRAAFPLFLNVRCYAARTGVEAECRKVRPVKIVVLNRDFEIKEFFFEESGQSLKPAAAPARFSVAR